MNELLVLLETARNAGWVGLIAVLAIAGGMLLFDRTVKAPSIEAEEEWKESKAA